MPGNSLPFIRTLVNNMQVIQLSQYDPRWPQEFEQARSDLLWAAEGFLRRVEHVGGTAIPAMIARPEIDMLAAVARQADLIPLRPYLIGIGFEEAWIEIDNDMPLACYTKPRRGVAAQRVFVTTDGSQFWREAMCIRDLQQQSPSLAARYRQLKLHVVSSHPDDPAAYLQHKQTFWRHVVDQFEAERRDEPNM